MTAQGYTGANVSMGDVDGLSAALAAMQADYIAKDGLVAFTANAAYDLASAGLQSKPADHGMVGWTYDPVLSQTGTVLATSGLSYITRIRATASVVSNILMHFTAGGSGLTGAYATLHNNAGAILGAGAATADQSASQSTWSAGGFKVMPLLVAQGVTPGQLYIVRYWFTGTTGPTVTRAISSASAIVNANLAAPSLRYATADSGLTTATLAPQNIGTQTGTAVAHWVGLS